MLAPNLDFGEWNWGCGQAKLHEPPPKESTLALLLEFGFVAFVWTEA